MIAWYNKYKHMNNCSYVIKIRKGGNRYEENIQD